MTNPVVRPLYVPPRRRARRPIPTWLRRLVLLVSLALAIAAGVAFSNWIGSVSDSTTGTEAVNHDGGANVTPMTSRPAPATTAAPPPTTADPAATTTPDPPSAKTVQVLP